MPANSVGINELNDGRFFGDVGIYFRKAPRRDLLIRLPAHSHMRNFQIAKNGIVESVFAFE